MQLNNCADQSQSLIQSVQWFVQTEHWISNFVIVHNSILRAILLSYILGKDCISYSFRNLVNMSLLTNLLHVCSSFQYEQNPLFEEQFCTSTVYL